MSGNDLSAPPPGASGLKVHILGIGEITTTIEIQGPHWGKLHPTEKRWMRLAYKRLPAFETRDQAENYVRIHNRYQELLEGLGIRVPWHDNLLRRRSDDKWVVYNRQERLPTRQVACLVIRDLDHAASIVLFRLLLERMAPLFLHNLDHPELLIGFDGQAPNWILPDYDHLRPAVRPGEPVVYIDTSTPLLRLDGVEQLDPELFLRSVPALVRPVLRAVALQHVLDRYYQPRSVVMDLVASYLVHGRPDLVPDLVEEANRFLAGARFAAAEPPLTVQEVRNYNLQDVAIWHTFRTMKRLDRWVGERFLGRTYEQRLPRGSPRKWKNLVGAGGQGLTPEDE